MATPEPATVLGVSMVAIMAMDPLGIDMPHLAAGLVCVTVGLGGRVCFDLQRSFEPGGTSINLGKTLGWFGAGLLGAPFLTVLFLVGMRAVGVSSDAMAVIGLAVLGFMGSRGVSWLIGSLEGLMRRQFGQAPPPPEGGGP